MDSLSGELLHYNGHNVAGARTGSALQTGLTQLHSSGSELRGSALDVSEVFQQVSARPHERNASWFSFGHRRNRQESLNGRVVCPRLMAGEKIMHGDTVYIKAWQQRGGVLDAWRS